VGTRLSEMQVVTKGDFVRSVEVGANSKWVLATLNWPTPLIWFGYDDLIDPNVRSPLEIRAAYAIGTIVKIKTNTTTALTSGNC
jgi:hypothetical protein